MENTAKSQKHEYANGMDRAVSVGDVLWQYGWTHYGTSGQTPARLHPHTREVEIKDGDEWVRCASGADAFFTPGFLAA